MLRRVPIESSSESVLVVALARVLLALTGLVSVAIVGFPEEGRLVAIVAGLALPWALLTLALARVRPEAAFHPLFPAIDMAVLVAVEAVAPFTYGAVRFAALLLIAVHAHLQGALRGVIIAAATATGMIFFASLGPSPLSTGLLVFYELTFFVAALGVAVLVLTLLAGSPGLLDRLLALATPGYAAERSADAAGLTLLFLAPATGALLGGALLAARSGAVQQLLPLALGSGAVALLSGALLAMTPFFLVTVGLFLLLGAAKAAFSITLMAALQRRVPDHARGRLLAF